MAQINKYMVEQAQKRYLEKDAANWRRLTELEEKEHREGLTLKQLTDRLISLFEKAKNKDFIDQAVSEAKRRLENII